MSNKIQAAPDLETLARMLGDICTAMRDLPDGVSESIAIVMEILNAVAEAVLKREDEKLKVLIGCLVRKFPTALDQYVSIGDYALLLSAAAEIVPERLSRTGDVDLQATAAGFSDVYAI